MRAIARSLRWLSAKDPVLGIAMLVVVLYYVLTPGPFQGKASGDGWFGFLYLKAIVKHHTIDMQLAAPDYVRFFGLQGPGHHMPNRCPIGPVTTWMPFYLVSMIPEWLGRLAGWSSARWGGQAPAQAWIAGLGTLIPVLVGWRALYLLLLRHTSVAAARLGAGIAMFATPLLWYTTQQPFYQHGLAFAAVAIFVERWDATRGQTAVRRFALLGALAGFALSVRLQELVWTLPLVVEVIRHLVRGPDRRRWLIGAGVGVLAAMLAFAPQAAAWIYYTGSLTPPQVEPLRWREPFLLTTLFSTRAGLIPWTPVIYLAVGGLLWGARQKASRALVIGLCVAFAIETYIVSCAWVLAAGYSFGNRRLSDGAVLWGLGVAFAWQAAHRRWLKRAVAGFAAFCLVFNCFLIELVSSRRIASSSAYSKPLSAVFEVDLHASPSVVRAVEWIGYPFAQPAGYLFALTHRVRPSMFEAVVGMNFLERDGQWFTVLLDRLDIVWGNHNFVAEGLSWPVPHDKNPTAPGQVTGPVRFLFSMFGPEALEVTWVGTFPEGPIAMRWNDQPVKLDRVGTGLRAQVPQPLPHPGVNDIRLDLPVGSTIRTVIFRPTSPKWW